MRGGVKAGDAAAARTPRAPTDPPAPEFAEAIEALTREIRDPVARLRVLRSSIERYGAVDHAVTALPSPRARRLAYRWLRLEGLRVLLWGASGVRLATRLALVVGLLGGAVAGGAALLREYRRAPAVATAAVSPPDAAPVAPPARAVVPDSAGVPQAALDTPGPRSALPSPAMPSIWLVEKARDAETYSNGLRIDTAYTTEGQPRRFRAFDLEGRLQEEIFDRPVGLLYHTSESDIWPMDASYNESLRDSSQRLLRYLRRERVYNYLIDRFGRVYRVVAEAQRANHAGHSIWAAGGRVYLNLNNAFLGVSFESRWGGGNALPITEAQLLAGRLLTDYLRQRWSLDADMCVTHGLTSVNPGAHLIGHHVDWARGFPFATFGLPDQYSRPSPAVALFGFGHDEELLRKMGSPWEGVRAAERLLEAEAGARGLSLDALRRERRALYRRWISEQARGEGAAPAGAERASADPSTRALEGRETPGDTLLRVSGG